MKLGFNEDRQLEIKFSRTLKSILGNQFIVRDEIEDLENGTDFLLLRVNPFRIGIRLRRYHYYGNYSNEFTIRWSRPSGVDTEIHKINNGLVDYILYGFVNSNESKLIQYFIGDLDVFRIMGVRPKYVFTNKPPDSQLAVYDLAQFPTNFVLKFWEKNGGA